MSTDRELLELAAKAVGLPECGWMGPAFMYVDNNQFKDWNPLEDDGDALRLAVKLGQLFPCFTLGIFNRAVFPHAAASIVLPNGDNTYVEQDDNADMAETTRRAIVRAAAEIGKSMP